MWYFGLLTAVVEAVGYIPVVVIIAIALIFIGIVLIKGAFLIGKGGYTAHPRNGRSEFDYDEALYRDFNGREDRKKL